MSKEEATFIGRSKDCQIYLRPEYSNTSRYHAKVKLEDVDGEMVWLLWDLETPNGTFVNNKKIESSQQLQSEDRVTLGKPNGARFVFEWKAIELTQLNEIFRQKPSYDETIIPSVDELKQLEEQTQIAANRSFDRQTNALNIDRFDLNQKELAPDTDDRADNVFASSDVSSKSDRNNKSLIQLLAKGAIALIFILVALSLIYKIPESIEGRKRREESLASYISNISRLLTDKKLSSLSLSDSDARKARESANAQTLTTLKNLDGEAKGTLFRFLHGAKLVKIQPQALSEEWFSREDFSSKQVVRFLNQGLAQKELVYIRGLRVEKARPTLFPVFLASPATVNQQLMASDSKGCRTLAQKDKRNLGCSWIFEFSAKSYEQPFVTPVQLSGADLIGVKLKDAPLERSNLEGAYLSLQSCKEGSSGNFFVDTFYQKPIRWFQRNKCSADFSGAGLQDSRLFRSVLMGANLRNAKLDYADLRQVDLRGANLSGVSWQGAVLKGACYLEEDWQKNFPEQGPNGGAFDPVAEGMKAVSSDVSNVNDPLLFKECKSVAASNQPTAKQKPQQKDN
ncbi:pentapeptide repeat-containing protein [Acaryochloris thomasi]|uniref:pentapeptide repeat-containing protein n=1 Tax=Acaryochloris thomasi TaxID=2929456 RepID=UPI001314FB68|nr:pentapeptide repeat-containing protein [Acaryochloris thomasi]